MNKLFSTTKFFRYLNIKKFTNLEKTIFDKVINKSIKADIVYEDDKVISFNIYS
jgi:hypothetical protein